MISSSIFVTLTLALFTIAVPFNGLQERNEQNMFNPTITSPKKGQVWIRGHSYNVTWETKNIPADMKKSTGKVVLGYDSTFLDIKHPLAVDFPLVKGWVTVKVPSNQTPRHNYMVVLFGNSGNMSPPFSICA